jgi:glycerol dehydrogenase-like iron-containing ADH family enzyme
MHGEVVALGTVIAVFLQGGDHQRICSSLDAARVRFRPRELGLSWPEVKHSLCSVSGYNRRVRRWPSVFDHVPITGQVLHDLREAVGG